MKLRCETEKLTDFPSMASLRIIGDAYGIEVQEREELILLDHIDFGVFSFIFRLSKYRVLKVQKIPDDIFWYELLADEIEGSIKLKRALPILKLVGVYIPRQDREGMLHVGLLRRYLPLEITKKEASRVWVKGEPDCKRGNFRKDFSGRIYRVDTQMLSFLEEENE
jgi:hypothetical protein